MTSQILFPSNGLIDIPLTGGNFTWSNNREVSSMSRLIVSCSQQIGLKVLLIFSKEIDRLNSDHFPVLWSVGIFREEGVLSALKICG
jgi:hypothetical protein